MTAKVKMVRPLGNRILVKREIETSKGGILLPESSQEKPKQGEVVAVGPGKVDDQGHHQKMLVKEGDTIVFSSYAGTKISLKGDEGEYLIMTEDDVLAVLE
ncbi:MAG: co-chaperone GroES [Chlamydiales bacterium]|nr:co-chaperone GroES [Chlamydiales bacterium]